MLPFEDANYLYELAARGASIRLRPNAHPAAHQLLAALHACIREIRATGSGQQAVDAVNDLRLWVGTVSRSLAPLQTISGSSLRFDHSSLTATLASIQHLLPPAGSTAPQSLLAAHIGFEGLPCTPLLDDLQDELDQLPQSARVVVVFPRIWCKTLGPPAATVLQHRAPSVDIVSDKELVDLDGLAGVSSLVMVGPLSSWAPHVFTAPRSLNSCFLFYGKGELRKEDFLTDLQSQHSLADGGQLWLPDITLLPPPATAAVSAPHISGTSASGSVALEVDGSGVTAGPADEADEVDWAHGREMSVANALRSRVDATAAGTEVSLIEARVVSIAGGRFCLVRADDDARVHVLTHVGSTGRLEVREVHPRALTEGHYLVRREGYSDAELLSDYADRIVGDRAPSIRDFLARYKGALRIAARTAGGISHLEGILKSKGMVTPTLRYKLAGGSIGRTETLDDWRVLMRHLRLGEPPERDGWWADLGLLADAHKRAGADIRTELEAALASQRIQVIEEAIEAAGVFAVAVGGDVGPSFTLQVLRVDHFDPSGPALSVDEAQLRHVFTQAELRRFK